MKLVEERVAQTESENRPFTSAEQQSMAKYYTPQQIEAIIAAEKSIDTNDLALQGQLRSDAWRMEYLDDFTKLRSAIDYPSNSPSSPHPTTSVAPAIPKLPDSDFTAPTRLQTDTEGPMDRLAKISGFDLKEMKGFHTRVLVNRRVVNQTRLGKIQSISILALAGNGDGLLGLGVGKAAEFADAMKHARLDAIRNMKPVPRYEGRTIFGTVHGKVGAVQVELSSRPPGFGTRVSHLIFEICKAAGITDLSARVGKSRNPMNTVKAAYEALMSQRLPEDVARGRGKKLVDVRKVYYAGNVL
ncbi:hypothetical protein P152DRAFT_465132 [Eremomyces bilateralis CBS 781.70]|uniref:Small ribosomal subunit protein uS5m n=1 Tax=Eremomyces bilateralis CBS 781.70 TaxID=1392243 RepID=A0A6G1G8G2_9PEZI|nr:uncharacterized protein P152DRAFT_465132 [Eremomyces bilateralis CBS 781.70]KAF1814211.1 hypothetical protein P152DRAFT_465132 [Eremomyces bilateralis CBS 781.70]